LTFQLTYPENQGRLPYATRGCEQRIGAVGQFPLQASDVSRPVKEVVMFNG